jgi:glycosyltransferase involved in cell wall biosynthesis
MSESKPAEEIRPTFDEDDDLTSIELAYLRAPVFREGDRIRVPGADRASHGAVEEELVDRVFEGGVVLDDLIDLLAESGTADGREGARERLRKAFSEPDNVIGSIELKLRPHYDVILVEQGYGGVYVHSVELFKRLSKRWRCLLLAPEAPLFDDSVRGRDVVTLKGLREHRPELTYFSYVHIARSIVKRTACKLLLIAHRSQSLFLFDLIRQRQTVIYCDGYFDGMFRLGKYMGLRADETSRRRILSEVYYLIGNNTPEFYGIQSSPSVNLHLLGAGWISLRDAKENWCWGDEQAKNFRSAFPPFARSVRFMLPFTDPGLFHPGWEERDHTVLFTTTMHNIEKKGFPELVKVMQRIPEMRVRCVVRQPDRLPPWPKDKLLSRLEIGGLKKEEMIRLYHRVWLNFRASREESSPLSILEAMVCKIPQIVSPTVARQIPFLENGKTGYVVDPDDTRGLVRAVRKLLEDPELRDQMGEEAHVRAIEHSLERRIRTFERLLG